MDGRSDELKTLFFGVNPSFFGVIRYPDTSRNPYLSARVHHHDDVAVNWEYVAGFLDGDGTFSMPRGYPAVVYAYNTDECAISNIRAFTGEGSIFKRTWTTNHFGKKPVYVWQTSSLQARHLINRILPYLFLNRAKALGFWHLDNVPTSIMTWGYIAGFFDAEGSVSYVKSAGRYRITFTNRAMWLLEAIRVFMGFGKTWRDDSIGRLYIDSHMDQLKLAENVLPHAIVKQARL